MELEKLLYDDSGDLLRVLVKGALAYLMLILFLRISGKRTLSKMNAFDLIVTIALGSTLATVLLNKEVKLAEAAVAFGLLIALQFLVTWTSVRIRSVRQFVTGEPRLLFLRGTFLDEAMRRDRVTKQEIRAAIRAEGFGALDQVEAVVMETNGGFSVVPMGERETLSSLVDVKAKVPISTGEEADVEMA